MIKASLSDGSAMDKFRAMIQTQGVDVSTAHALCKPRADVFHVLPVAKYKTDVFAPITGLVSTPFVKILVTSYDTCSCCVCVTSFS